MIRRFSAPLLVAVLGAGLSAIIFATAPDIGPTPPDPESILKRIMREAIGKLARAVVQFCRTVLGFPQPPPPGGQPGVELPQRPPALKLEQPTDRDRSYGR